MTRRVVRAAVWIALALAWLAVARLYLLGPPD
jgi:hypothetical protein